MDAGFDPQRMRNVKLVVAYDGSGYHGWQRQADGIVTVQQSLEEALVRIVNHRVVLRASSRTDTGVHATGQAANFFTNTPIPTCRLAHAVNSRLPRDIRVRKALDVPDNFDAIISARSKLYRYRICNHHDLPPQMDRYCYHYYHRCELSPMQQAAAQLVGEHDFASFATTGHGRLSTIRTLLSCEVWRRHHELYLDIEGDGFLYNMVRNIVGTLLDIGRGHWSVERVGEILAARDRSSAGPTAPPNGLTLQWVRY